MSGTYDPAERLIWSLTGSGLTTTISAAGNSGNWSFPAGADYGSSPVDLGRATDVGLFVVAGTKNSSPTLTVSLDVYVAGQYISVLSTAGITGTGAATPVYGGLHGYGSGTYFVMPHWGRVSWTLTGGGSFGNCEILLIGR